MKEFFIFFMVLSVPISPVFAGTLFGPDPGSLERARSMVRQAFEAGRQSPSMDALRKYEEAVKRYRTLQGEAAAARKAQAAREAAAKALSRRAALSRLGTAARVGSGIIIGVLTGCNVLLRRYNSVVKDYNEIVGEIESCYAGKERGEMCRVKPLLDESARLALKIRALYDAATKACAASMYLPSPDAVMDRS